MDLIPTEKKIKLDLSKEPWLTCNGGESLFEASIMFKRLSPIVSPTGKEELIPMDVIVCKKCGKIPQFFWEQGTGLPENVKSYCLKVD